MALFISPIVFEILTGEGEEHSFHILLGQVLFIFYIVVIIVYLLRQHSRYFDKKYREWKAKVAIPESVKKWTMRILGLACLYAYFYCHNICTKRFGGWAAETNFFHRNFLFSYNIFIFFVLSCLLGGFIIKHINSRRLRYPRGMLSNGIFAAILPTCSCGSIPIARAMFATGKIPVRSIVTFIMVAPVLSPFLIIFSLQLGYMFALCRVFFIFILAMATGILVENLAGVKDKKFFASPAFSCHGCNKNKVSSSTDPFIIAWDMFFSLAFYLIVGIIIGNLIASFLPVIQINELITSKFLGLLIVTAVTLPMFLCAGQEVLLLAPMMNAAVMGRLTLPLGHAIAFTFAGTGICLSAVPLFLNVFGKKATWIVILSFFFGSIICGILINKFIPFSGI